MSRTPIPRQQKTDNSYYGGFHLVIGDQTEAQWKEFLDEQDFDAIIHDIREEILAHVNEECYKKYLKNEMYNFLIECTHKAFQQIVTLHFYVYDDSHKYSPSQESWIPDEEPEPCKPDSWAKGNIPYNTEDIPKNKFQQTENPFEYYTIIKCDEYPTTDVFSPTVSPIEPEVISERASSFSHIVDSEEAMHTSQTSVHYTEYDLSQSTEMIPYIQDVPNQPCGITAENTFYKIMRINRASSGSIQQSIKGKKFYPPGWTTIDDIRDLPNKRCIGQNRVSTPIYVGKQVPE